MAAPQTQAAQLLALQPVWLPRGQRGALAAEDRQALTSDVTPPSSLRGARRSAARTAKIAAVVVVLGLLLAAVGAMTMLGDDPEGRGLLTLFAAGLVLLVAMPLSIGSALTVRRYVPNPLVRIHDTIVDVRRTARLGHDTYQRAMPIPHEVQLASGVVIELPINADALAQTLVPGHRYRIWYLPATTTFVPHQLIYIDLG